MSNKRRKNTEGKGEKYATEKKVNINRVFYINIYDN